MHWSQVAFWQCVSSAVAEQLALICTHAAHLPGLVGPIIITSKGHANADGSTRGVDHDFVSLFQVRLCPRGGGRGLDAANSDPEHS